MNKLAKTAVQQRRQYLIDQLINIGVFKIGEKHLYELTIGALEEEIHSLGLTLMNSHFEQDMEMYQ